MVMNDFAKLYYIKCCILKVECTEQLIDSKYKVNHTFHCLLYKKHIFFLGGGGGVTYHVEVIVMNNFQFNSF